MCEVFAANPVIGVRAYPLPVDPEKAAGMEVKVYVRNLPKSTTGNELNTLFAQAGEVTAVDLITDRQSGMCRGYAFVTMSAQNEADRAVSMFNTYSLEDHQLKVALVRSREQRGFQRAF